MRRRPTPYLAARSRSLGFILVPATLQNDSPSACDRPALAPKAIGQPPVNLPHPLRRTQAPLAAIVLFGAVLLCQLLFGVVTFRTVPEEAELLQKVGGRDGRGFHDGAFHAVVSCWRHVLMSMQAGKCKPSLQDVRRT